jgi:hypothetical protein
MDTAQRKLIAQGFVDLANLIPAALVFGQFVSESRFHGYVFAVGLFFTVTLYLVGTRFSKEKGNSHVNNNI